MKIDHTPVMLGQALEYLGPAVREGLLIDCTCGEGGHSSAFLNTFPSMRLIGVDTDSQILEKARERMTEHSGRFELINSWFDTFLEEYETYGFDAPDAILFDFGISIHHYESSGRGFSFNKDEPLDMRLRADSPLSASDIVNSYPAERLADVIYQYGEERLSRRIASAICSSRQEARIESSYQLAQIIWHAVPRSYRYGRIHPATRTFQALRIEVNGELERIEAALKRAVSILRPGGRIGAISFHSLEDRIVKQTFKRLERGCTCEEDQMHCTCERTPIIQLLNKKPITATDEENTLNPPSRSAKFRFAVKL